MSNPFDELAELLRDVRLKQDQLEAKIDQIIKSDSNDDLITREEKAAQLKVSLPTLRNWELNGIMTPIRKGRRVYFSKQERHPKSRNHDE